MRTHLFLAMLGLGAFAGGCKWTDFDDLAEETWVRSVDEPDLGANDYAIGIVGVSNGTTGGTLAVASDDAPTFSTIEYTSDGSADYGGNPLALTSQNIGALSETPVFISDGASRIALIDRSINGSSFALLVGSATAPAGLDTMSATQPVPQPDAAVFAGNTLLFAAGDKIYSVPVAGGGSAVACTGLDQASMPLQTAALAADSSRLWVWTKSGALISYALTDVTPCTGGTLPAPAGMPFISTGFMPSAGARLFLVGNYAVLAARASGSRTGQVYVVDTTNNTQVGTTVTIEGMGTALLATLGGSPYLAVGIPDRTVEGVAAGAVDVHAFTATSGVLEATASMTLHDAQPESGQAFGRSLATMNFNGNPILVVGANQEVFAYYRTALYDHLP